MSHYVVDVNVGIVANGRYPEFKDVKCQLVAIEELEKVMRNIICLDSEGLIFKEYHDNLSLKGQPGAGDEFVFWVNQNQYNPEKSEVVNVNIIHTPEGDAFEAFPDDEGLANFDKSDRKYVVVALKSENSPIIINATDSDWLHFNQELSSIGLNILEICPWTLKSEKK